MTAPASVYFPNRFQTSHRRYHLNLEYLVERPMALIDQFLRDRGKGNTDAYRPFVEELQQQVRAVPTSGEAYGIIHGDLHSGNFHFAPQNQLTLFDFDHGGYGWRAYDLATCRGRLSAEAWEAFLEGYQTVRPLSEAERESIPAFGKIRPIWDKGDVLAMRAAWGDEQEFGDEFADQIITMFEKLLETRGDQR